MEIPEKPVPERFKLSFPEELALFGNHVSTMLKYIDQYNREEITLAQLGKALDQSPEVLRAVFVPAGKRMGADR